MLFFEMISWAALGLVMAVARFFFSEESGGQAARIFAGASAAALFFGFAGRALSAQSVVQAGYAPLGLLFAGIGAMLFLAGEWLWRRRHPGVRG